MTFFHIDRDNGLFPGKVLEPFKDLDSPEYARDGFGAMLESLFPEGVSMHGLRYLQTPRCPDEPLNTLPLLRDRMLEQNFELCRRAAFPNRPSRLQSMFCLESIDDFQLWPELLWENHLIYEIDPLPPGAPAPAPSGQSSPGAQAPASGSAPFRADASLLEGGVREFLVRQDGLLLANYSLPRDYENASRYWSGEASPHPKWEWVIPLPARVVRAVARWDCAGMHLLDE